MREDPAVRAIMASTQGLDWSKLITVFGDGFIDEKARHASYQLTESFVEGALRSAHGVPDTATAVEAFSNKLTDMPDPELAFLLVHSGFIPDHYGDDSSDETLYSKLIETLVAECGRRIGHATTLPTAKASYEDVTFINGDAVIVSDIKSYRLGRSQQAPNVKDVIKAEDYNKWLQKRPETNKCGGLVVFPSRFDFSKGSDVYLYASNPTEGRRILILFFEHLAFLLVNRDKLTERNIFDIIDNYPTYFEKADKSRTAYWKQMDAALASVAGGEDPAAFFDSVQPIVHDSVLYAANRIEERVTATRKALEEELEHLDADELKARLLPSEFEHKCGADLRRLYNIKKFRL